jgi:spore maturation protein CgeB
MSRILFLLEDYNYFYTNGSSELLEKTKNISYKEMMKQLLSKKHYQSDGLANSFRELGHEVEIAVPEANPLQLQWLKENDKGLFKQWKVTRPVRSFKSRFLKRHRTSYNHIQFKTLLAQVKKFEPEVIYYYSNIVITKEQAAELKARGVKIVLQWSCPIWDELPDFPYKSFDLITTAAPQLRSYFEKEGQNVYYMQQAFDDSIVKELKPRTGYKGDVVFIGSFSLGHQLRSEVLEFLLESNVDIQIHGTGKDLLPKGSLLASKLQAPVYGVDMYNTYRNYRMAIHIHTTGKKNDGIDWDRFAGAKRIFEITGSGTLLLTSNQENIAELFEIGKEVVTFENKNDLLEKINYYKTHTKEAEEIALRGMQRTLKDHSFNSRAKELSKVLFN